MTSLPGIEITPRDEIRVAVAQQTPETLYDNNQQVVVERPVFEKPVFEKPDVEKPAV